MGKGDFFSPKNIANRQKAKGLQKLRWYCQMCQKQCRDDNGFQMHIKSEGHQRQMKLFQQNSGHIIENYSTLFEQGMLKLLSVQYGTKRVFANKLYNEYIKDKHHVHMNSTRWSSLAGFVRSLGQRGICLIDETEEGWYVQWIDKSDKSLARQEAIQRMERLKRDQEEEDRRMIQEQIERGRHLAADKTEYTDLQRSDQEADAKIKLQLTGLAASSSLTAASNHQSLERKPAGLFDDNDDDDEHLRMDSAPPPTDSGSSQSHGKRKWTALERIHLEEELRARRGRPSRGAHSGHERSSPSALSHVHNSHESIPAVALRLAVPRLQKSVPSVEQDETDEETPWIMEGLVVKVMNETLANGKYFKSKGKITCIVQPFVAEIRLLDGGDLIRVDEAYLETVLPALGGHVRFVKPFCQRTESIKVPVGTEARLVAIDVDRFCVSVDLLTDGNRVDGVEYDQVCKIE